MQAIDLKTDWRKRERENTVKEIERLKDAGMQHVTLDEYKGMLLCFGLKLRLSSEYALKYYNTMNEHHYLECTATATDSTGHSFCNVKSKIYHNPLMMQRVQRFRRDYFTTLKSGHILTI